MSDAIKQVTALVNQQRPAYSNVNPKNTNKPFKMTESGKLAINYDTPPTQNISEPKVTQPQIASPQATTPAPASQAKPLTFQQYYAQQHGERGGYLPNRDISAEQEALKRFGAQYGKMPSTDLDWQLIHNALYGGRQFMDGSDKRLSEAAANANVSAGADNANVPTSTPSPTPTPTLTPTDTGVDDSQLIALQNAYEESLTPTEEEIQLQNQINTLLSSAELGIDKLEGQGRLIPLGLLRGKQEQLGEQANIKIGSLQRQLANLQAQRTAQQNQALTQLGFEQQRLAREDKPPIAIGEGQSIIDPTTGEVIYSAPKTAVQPSPMTVSAGQAVIDPETGEVIFNYPAATTTEKPNTVTVDGNVLQYNSNTGGWDVVYESDTNKGKVVNINGVSMWQSEDGKFTKIDAPGVNEERIIELENNVELANEILNSPYLSKITGIINPFTYWTPGSNEQLVKNQFEQLTNMLSLDNRQKLKGTGSISDFEAKMLARASTALGKNLSDKDAKEQIENIKDIFQSALNRIQGLNEETLRNEYQQYNFDESYEEAVNLYGASGIKQILDSLKKKVNQ